MLLSHHCHREPLSETAEAVFAVCIYKQLLDRIYLHKVFVKQFWAGNKFREIDALCGVDGFWPRKACVQICMLSNTTNHAAIILNKGSATMRCSRVGFFCLGLFWWWIMSVKHFRKQKSLLYRNLPAILTAKPQTLDVWMCPDASLAWMTSKSSIM